MMYFQNTDFADDYAEVGADAVRDALAKAERISPVPVTWPDPLPFTDTLPPVPLFARELLPDDLRDWASDIAERMNCPLDFIGIPAMVAAGSLIGRRILIRPEQNTDWAEAANLWGCIVGPPGAMKSPAVREALAPMKRLEAQAAAENDRAAAEHSVAETFHKLQKGMSEERAKAALKKRDGPNPDALARAELEGIAEPARPAEKRFFTSDGTAEKLGEICAANPDGVLVHRDELLTMFADLDREEKTTARGLFLSGWGGLEGYTFDRIQRGTIRIPAVCLSVLGTTQPARLASYIAESLRVHDDGMVQRIQLLAFPDFGAPWAEADRAPNSDARARAFACYERLATLTAGDVGAERDPWQGEGAPPFLRLADDARAIYREWRAELEAELATDTLPNELRNHFAKYRGLIPKLALVCHLASGGTGPVSARAFGRALAWSDYLEAHAKRAYSALATQNAQTARAIWRRVGKGDLSDGFTARDVYRSQWSGLGDAKRVREGLDLLADCDWLRAERPDTGGRPSVLYSINPKAVGR